MAIFGIYVKFLGGTQNVFGEIFPPVTSQQFQLGPLGMTGKV